MDNAANNIAAMCKLSSLLEDCEIQFDPVDHRVPCFPHILSICITHMVKNYTKADSPLLQRCGLEPLITL